MEISGKSHNFIELLPSESYVSVSKNLLKKQKLNFSRTTLFHMKARVCLKYFVNDCRIVDRIVI